MDRTRSPISNRIIVSTLGDVLLSKPYRKRDLAEAVEAILTAQP
jgi:hypothetical protein